MDDKPVTWIKKKYTVGKMWGYRSNHNMGQRLKPRLHPLTETQKKAVRATQPDMLRVVSPTGKARMVRR